SWQARADQGFDVSHFQIDWTLQQATCPQGQMSYRWTPLQKPERIEVLFPRVICADCPVRVQCTQSRTTGRVLHLRPQAAHEALCARRAEEQTAAFRQIYACRAGIEGTLAQGVSRSGLRHTRYRGLQKTHVQHVLTAVALNVVRLDAWLGGKKPQGTRRSH